MSALRAEFQQLRDAADETVDVAAAALLVARCEKDEVAAEETLAELDVLASDAAAIGSPSMELRDQAEALADFLCAQRGFIGTTDYYQRYNSYLDEVLIRREGIPITLAVVYIAVGRRLGLQMDGINFPGHFLVRLQREENAVLIDPFSGTLTSLAACAERLKAFQGDAAVLGPQHLTVARSLDIVVRMLSNLKGIDMNAAEWESALTLSDRVLWLYPDHPGELSDRALILEQMGSFESAAFELQRLATMIDDSVSRQAISDRISALRSRARDGSDEQ